MAGKPETLATFLQIGESRLHKHSIEDIEFALAKGLEQLTGQPYQVRVRLLNRHPEGELSASLYDVVDISMRVRAVAQE